MCTFCACLGCHMYVYVCVDSPHSQVFYRLDDKLWAYRVGGWEERIREEGGTRGDHKLTPGVTV